MPAAEGAFAFSEHSEEWVAEPVGVDAEADADFEAVFDSEWGVGLLLGRLVEVDAYLRVRVFEILLRAWGLDELPSVYTAYFYLARGESAVLGRGQNADAEHRL